MDELKAIKKRHHTTCSSHKSKGKAKFQTFHTHILKDLHETIVVRMDMWRLNGNESYWLVTTWWNGFLKDMFLWVNLLPWFWGINKIGNQDDYMMISWLIFKKNWVITLIQPCFVFWLCFSCSVGFSFWINHDLNFDCSSFIFGLVSILILLDVLR